jgi:hypothetical protein
MWWHGLDSTPAKLMCGLSGDLHGKGAAIGLRGFHGREKCGWARVLS